MRDLVFENPFPFLRPWFPVTGEISRWREFETGAGPCDLLFAWEKYLVLVEMKRNIIDENAIGQIMRYRGAILSRYRLEAYGILCAPQISKNARLAIFSIIGNDLAEHRRPSLMYSQFSFSYLAKMDDAEGYVEMDKSMQVNHEVKNELTSIVIPKRQIPTLVGVHDQTEEP